MNTYIALGTRYHSREGTKTVIGAPYDIYAISKVSISFGVYNGEPPYYKVLGVKKGDGLELVFEELDGDTKEFKRVDKWVGESNGFWGPKRRLLNSQGASGVITKEEVIKLLTQ